LLAGVAMVLAVGVRPACAQGVFADVPTNHWAYDAVNELAAKGIFTGYPDQTFGGKRALTRYEFAVAIQRMLQDVQRQIDAMKADINELKGRHPGAAPQPGVSREEVDRLKADVERQRAEQERLRGAVDTLQRLMREFQDTLAALGADVDQLKRDVAALAERLGRVEEAIAKMPKITGTASVAFIGRKLRHPDRFVG